MILREWTVMVAPGRMDDLDEFARTRSAPMFASLRGCLGALFAAADEHYSVFTLWLDRTAVLDAENDGLYRGTSEALAASGIVRGLAEVRVLEVRQRAGFEDRTI